MEVSSSSTDSIPLTKMNPTSRRSSSFDEERDTLLHHSHPTISKSARTGAVWQIITFTAIGLLIALASGTFAYSLRGRTSSGTHFDFVHVPLPGMRNPSLLRYFGGMGPWIGKDYKPMPSNCKVTQVHMLARHGERYPTGGMGNILASFAANISNLASDNFRGDLAFLNGWNFTTDNWLYAPKDQLEQETLTGPAAGSTHMFTLGSEFRSRYEGLYNFRSASRGDSAVKVWSSDSERVIHSAKYFSSAFFGVSSPVDVEVIPETAERWGNSLTTTFVPI